MLQSYLFHSYSIQLVIISCYFMSCINLFEILYKSWHWRCFVFVELYIHFFLSNCRWDQMVLIPSLLFCLLLLVYCCCCCCYMDQYLKNFGLYFPLFWMKCFHYLVFDFSDWLAYCVCFCLLFHFITMVLLCGIMNCYFIFTIHRGGFRVQKRWWPIFLKLI